MLLPAVTMQSEDQRFGYSLLREVVNESGAGPSPSGRGRRDSLIEAGAPGEGRAKREPDRAKPQKKSNQILRPSPYPLPEGEGESSAITNLMFVLFVAALLLSPQEDLKQLQAVFETTAGNFIIEFYPDQ